LFFLHVIYIIHFYRLLFFQLNSNNTILKLFFNMFVNKVFAFKWETRTIYIYIFFVCLGATEESENDNQNSAYRQRS
jgi:hypothetical protein